MVTGHYCWLPRGTCLKESYSVSMPGSTGGPALDNELVHTGDVAGRPSFAGFSGATSNSRGYLGAMLLGPPQALLWLCWGQQRFDMK
jgi:hypothetical protein